MKLVKNKNSVNKIIIANKNINYYSNFFIFDNKKIKEEKKTDISASDNIENGLFNLYTSSNSKILKTNKYIFNSEYLILGDGGDFASINYHNGKFSATDHTWVISYENMNNKYMYFYWKKNIKNIDHCFQGTKLKNLKKPYFRKLKFIAPCIEEQNKIANLLSEKEQHIENIKTLISKLEKRNEYYAEKLLSGELRVKENEKGEMEFYENTEWKEVKLNNRIKLIPNDFKNIKFLELSKKHNEGGTPSTDNENFYKNGNIKWATIKDIKENMYDTNTKITEAGLKNSSAKMWEIDTLILSTGATIGNVGIVKSPLCTKQGILGIQIKENFHYKYFYYLLKSYKSIFNRYAEGSTFLSLKKGTLEKIDFMLPIIKEEQKVISDILDKFNKEKELLENLLEKETKEFEWLSEKLLSGEYIIEN